MILRVIATVLIAFAITATSSAAITEIGTESVWNKDGRGVKITTPRNTKSGDLMILAIHRTDYYLPLKLSGWDRVAECYKTNNGKSLGPTAPPRARHNNCPDSMPVRAPQATTARSRRTAAAGTANASTAITSAPEARARAAGPTLPAKAGIWRNRSM